MCVCVCVKWRATDLDLPSAVGSRRQWQRAVASCLGSAATQKTFVNTPHLAGWGHPNRVSSREGVGVEGTAAQYCDACRSINIPGQHSHTNTCGMLIIIPGNLCLTRLFFSQLQVLIAALSCIACRCNSLALIGCERAAISCTRMQLQPAMAHHNRNPCKRSRQIVADKGSANLNRSQAGCRKCSIDGQGS